MKILYLFLLLPLACFSQTISEEEFARLEARAEQVTIIRDKWGVPHVFGKTDADAVFGLMYAQCEDNFPGVELNYIKYLGRMAEVRGETEVYNDLKVRLTIDAQEAMADYKKCSPYVQGLLNAFADGVNFYLAINNDVKPLLLKKFEPWYPLVWTNGSIDHIVTCWISNEQIKAFYTGDRSTGFTAPNIELPSTGSNAIAVAPSRSESKNAMLYINPHVWFHYRAEAHIVSEEGLNAYGAITWGQFFVYQGFNDKCGWMHTSSWADAADLYIEKISGSGDNVKYLYNGKQLDVIKKDYDIKYSDNGTIKSKKITGLFTRHGPILTSKENNSWISLKAVNRSLEGFLQSWERMKAQNLTEFKRAMSYCADNTDNTTYADVEGNIAHFHGNFLPRRDPKYDWRSPVDGTTSATEWKGMHTLDEQIFIKNPEGGYIENCNSSPFFSAGQYSPKKENYPSYMAPDEENFRSINARRLLDSAKQINLNGLIAIGYDKTLAAFEIMVPALIKAYDKMETEKPGKYIDLQGAILELRNWDFKVAESSIATTLAIEWGERVQGKIGRYGGAQIPNTVRFAAEATPEEMLEPFNQTLNSLMKRFGRWNLEWGEINGYQRVDDNTQEAFNDLKQALPIAWASATWGMLPAFNSRYFPGTNIRYGVHGNSFVCAVEFGKKIKARSLAAGGASANPSSTHYEDQTEMYRKGEFKDVYFYREDIEKNAEKTYHPGY